MYHVTVAQMRLIEWARSWNWAIRFPDAETPEEFRQWFPATSITYTLGSVGAQSHNGGPIQFSFPVKTDEKKINLSIVDGGRSSTVKASGGSISLLRLHSWAKQWIGNISNHRTHTKTLTEACRRIDIIHYDPLSTYDQIMSSSYAVFPDGELTFNGDSEGGEVTFDMDLIIAGYIPTGKIKVGIGGFFLP